MHFSFSQHIENYVITFAFENLIRRELLFTRKRKFAISGLYCSERNSLFEFPLSDTSHKII